MLGVDDLVGEPVAEGVAGQVHVRDAAGLKYQLAYGLLVGLAGPP